MSESERLQWQPRTLDATAPDTLSRSHKLPHLVARVLAARGWQPGEALHTFLEAPSQDEPDYTQLIGVPEASARLLKAIDDRERITICGDYDIDGITSTSLLLAYFRKRGAVVDHFLPHRVLEGYGLNEVALRELAGRGTKVLVTVDNGITSVREVTLARELGMDVILTDHHKPGPELPPATVIINPRLMDDPGVLGPLAGVGVAYALARGVDAARPMEGYDARDLLDFVALGTLGDQSPLAQENRRLVRLGLKRIADNPRKGLAALARAVKCNLRQANLGEHLAQRVIPRLNAAGRLAHPTLALELLLCENDSAAKELAELLENLNKQRRTLSVATEHQAIAMLTGSRLADQPAIVLADAHWHHGVMGIVATRLAERFRKPVLLFAKEEGDYWRGSGRSALGLDLHAVLEELSDHLGRYGGHSSAVGLTVAGSGLDAFITAFNAGVARRGGKQEPAPKVWEVDAEVPLNELSYESVASLHVMQPTGPDNPAPVLAARNLNIRRQETRGPEGEHLFLELEDGSGRAEAIGFGMGKLHPLGVALVDIVFVPMAERWQGRNRLTLKLLEIKPAFLDLARGTGPL